MTGVVCSPMINGFETMKVQHQLNKKSLTYKTKFETIKLGFSATLIRESLGASIYFGFYNYLNKDYNSFVSGSIAGASSWLFTYPVDVIKTRLQSGNCKNWKIAISKGCLGKGLAICLIRSFIVNGFSFALYDYVKNLE